MARLDRPRCDPVEAVIILLTAGPGAASPRSSFVPSAGARRTHPVRYSGASQHARVIELGLMPIGA